MTKNISDIKDNEIRIIGYPPSGANRKFRGWKLILMLGAIILTGLVLWVVLNLNLEEKGVKGIDAPRVKIEQPLSEIETTQFTKVSQETVNDVPMYVYTPNPANVTLQIGLPDYTDNDIVLVAQAADVRADNGGIVGEFVDRGELLSKGVAKLGFCAIIYDHNIHIGVGKDTPLLQKAIYEKGYFFRQYPLVNNGAMVENTIKGKAIRRALAERRGEIIVVESRSTESFHDFSQALVDLECKNAIYLCGSTAYGWYRSADNTLKEFGVPNPQQSPMTSYIVWRK